MAQSKLKSEQMDNLFRAILQLQSEEECYNFFEDICTISELSAIAQRLKVAAMLREKKTCHEISEATGVSTATISRVNRCLNYGTGGYQMAFQRIEGE